MSFTPTPDTDLLSSGLYTDLQAREYTAGNVDLAFPAAALGTTGRFYQLQALLPPVPGYQWIVGTFTIVLVSNTATGPSYNCPSGSGTNRQIEYFLGAGVSSALTHADAIGTALVVQSIASADTLVQTAGLGNPSFQPLSGGNPPMTLLPLTVGHGLYFGRHHYSNGVVGLTYTSEAVYRSFVRAFIRKAATAMRPISLGVPRYGGGL